MFISIYILPVSVGRRKNDNQLFNLSAVLKNITQGGIEYLRNVPLFDHPTAMATVFFDRSK